MIASSDLFAVAARFQRFGTFVAAEQLYRQVVQEQPDHAGAWCELGEVCRALGRHEEAVRACRRSLALHPDCVRAHTNLGLALLEQGQRDDAIAAFREALRFQPAFAPAHHHLGAALLEQGFLEEAATACREALRLEPSLAAAHDTLGRVLAQQGNLSEAASCFGRAAQLQPDFGRAWLHLGDALRGLGRHDEAGASYEQLVRLRPGELEPHLRLAELLMELGRPADATLCYERALRLRPDSAALYNNLGLALLKQQRWEEAVLSLQQALYLEPDLAEACNNLGLGWLNQDQVEEARHWFQRAVQLKPDLADAHNNLAVALDTLRDSDGAWTCLERAVQLQPNHGGALANLGSACTGQGYLTEAVAYYRRALALRPGDARTHSNLLLALLHQPGVDPLDIREEARRYAQQHAAPLAAAIQPHALRPLEGRRLRIGYVSTDFREHAVACFLEPILANHDHQHFEIFCYADVPRPDAVTQRFQGYADQWCSLVGMSDARAAERIRQDGIDVLVDLVGHSADGRRLLVFARKPAPVQVSFLGYLGTTGLPTIDYYITDVHADPPGWTEGHYQEQLVRLPECGCCYRPGAAPDVVEQPPARKSGRVTFGCLNRPAKVNDEVLTLWSRILAAVPGSRLLLRGGWGRRTEDRLRDTLARQGIAPERLLLAGRTPTHVDYLKLFWELDLSLDPFPHNGITVTCDSLWMGVPVLSLAGRTTVSRQGVQLLTNVGLDEWIADTPEDYVQRAVELAGDLDRLAALRNGLRQRMSRSPLLDGLRFTRHLEAAYRATWDKWTEK
jgi:protein O-GlcNAc transferase